MERAIKGGSERVGRGAICIEVFFGEQLEQGSINEPLSLNKGGLCSETQNNGAPA
jgi:hypothetical protein